MGVRKGLSTREVLLTEMYLYKDVNQEIQNCSIGYRYSFDKLNDFRDNKDICSKNPRIILNFY